MKQKKTNGRFSAASVVMLLLLGIFLFSAVRVFAILRQRELSRQANDQLAMLAVTPNEELQTAAQAQTTVSVPVPITVDFEQLKQENEDIVAWLHCPDTPIHYPVVQGQDNVFYLKHMIDGQRNDCGAIFLDCESSKTLSDSFSLIYGHNLKNDTMFGSLLRYAEQAYYDEHKDIFVLTPETTYVLELFAGFTTDSDDGLYTLPLTETTRERVIENSIARSDFVSGLRPETGDRLLALSTCSYAYDDARYVVIGVLRENQAGFPNAGAEKKEVTQ